MGYRTSRRDEGVRFESEWHGITTNEAILSDGIQHNALTKMLHAVEVQHRDRIKI